MLWYSLEAPRRGASNEYPQHMFSWRNKKDISIFLDEKAPYLLLCFTLDTTFLGSTLNSIVPVTML